MLRFQCSIFLKMWKTIKNGKCQLLKMTRSRYIAILIKSWKGPELVSSSQHWAKNMSEIFALQYNCIWPSFILKKAVFQVKSL